MIRRFSILLCLIFLCACDDGDILTVDLDFSQELESCDDFEDSYLIFDTREDPNEALILIFPRTEANSILFTTETTVELPINSSTVRFIYRTYNRSLDADDICAVLPPSDLIIRENYEADSGTVFVTVTAVDDDNDGIASIYEDLNGNGNYDDDDSDDDGIPDYKDEDDDNDNVKTINEIDNDDVDADDNPTTNPLDTDGDGTPDYLDTDDDNDNTLTILEDANGLNGPFDDTVIDTDGIVVKRYLYDAANDTYANPGNISNEFNRTVTTHFLVSDIDIEILRATEIDLGTLTTIFDVTSE